MTVGIETRWAILDALALVRVGGLPAGAAAWIACRRHAGAHYESVRAALPRRPVTWDGRSLARATARPDRSKGAA